MLAKHQVLFVQGGGEGVHRDWDQQLVDSLRRELGQSYELHYPRMPHEAEPEYASWQKALQRELAKLRDGAIVVAHSIGATILLAAVAEHPPPRKLGALLLIGAPFVGDGGWSFADLPLPADLGKRLPRGVPVHFFHGLEDETAPPSHLDLYARAVPQAHTHRLPGRDHQLNDDLKEVAATIASLEI
jgi:pimeloyl-ACP methyl ester carboxylesterase